MDLHIEHPLYTVSVKFPTSIRQTSIKQTSSALFRWASLERHTAVGNFQYCTVYPASAQRMFVNLRNETEYPLRPVCAFNNEVKHPAREHWKQYIVYDIHVISLTRNYVKLLVCTIVHVACTTCCMPLYVHSACTWMFVLSGNACAKTVLAQIWNVLIFR